MMERDQIVSLLVQSIYAKRIINNAHRGDLVEIMVLAALGDGWELVGLGWHPWDLQRGKGPNRVRIQVKQAAALQLWGETKDMSVNFGWKDQAPRYFERDNPDEAIEKQGYFCELIVVGIHLEKNRDVADQVDPNQWQFCVIPTKELPQKQGSMKLEKVLERWPAVKYGELRQRVAQLFC